MQGLPSSSAASGTSHAGEPARDQAATPGSVAPVSAGNQHRLVKNTMYLTLAQAVTIPISVVANALVGRFLGAEVFGHFYLATTLCSFAILALEWGQQGAIPALISRDHSQAGVVLGTSLAWRWLVALPIVGILMLSCVALRYGYDLRVAVALAFLLSILNSCASGYKDAIRGFERTDIPAYAHVGQQLMMLVVVVPVLLLGGKLPALLLAHSAVTVLVLVYLHRSMRPLGVPKLQVRRSAVGPLFSIGTPFVFLGFTLVLLPNINVTFLSKLVPPDVLGWYGVSQKLIGLLIFPASALIGALYPTLCRLFSEDKAEFARVSRSSLYGVSLLAIPAAVGSGLFPELGVAIYSTEKFTGAIDHLRVMSLFVFLVYFSMPLGTSIMASNRAKLWSLVMCISIVVALIVNPLLVPWFQARTGNGALGTCVGLVISEALVVACGVALSPREVFDKSLGKSLALALVAGAAMGVVAYFTKPLTLFVAVPLSLLTYAAVAWYSGAIQQSTVDMVKGFIARKFSRAR
jgi:O-antigen/teichoic acid export membrane protein